MSDSSPNRILIVDDEVPQMEALCQTLQGHGYQTTGFANAREAISSFKRDQPDLVLTDLMMPDINGIALLKELRELDPDSVGIVMTGEGTIATAVDAMKAGAFDYILKPFKLSTVLPIISRALGVRRLKQENTRLQEHIAAQAAALEAVRKREAEREKAELTTQIEAQRERLNNIVANVPGIVWEAWGKPDAATQRTDFVSDYVETMLGYTVQEWISKPNFWLSIVHPDDKKMVAQTAAADFASQAKKHIREFRWQAKDGHVIWVQSHSVVIRDDHGQPVGMRGVTLDITERKTLEKQFRQAQKMEAIGQLAGGVAHDFNNLLTVIIGFSDLALSKLREEDPLRRNLEEIKKAGNRAAGLTRQLLAFSRKQVLQPVVLDLNSIVSDLEKMLGRLIGEDIELKTVLATELGYIKADPGQVEQVIMNLAVNARDAMPHGGKLIIETQNISIDENYAKQDMTISAGSYVMLTITDTGAGMDANTQARIFEPFFTTKSKEKGTGLGLSTVYGIIKQSGGSIGVSSELGRGAAFKVYLPRVDKGAMTQKRELAEIKNTRGNETILLVEDDDLIRALALQVLETTGYTVFDATNGGAALLICERHQEPIHLLLTDLVMLEMSGHELAERLTRMRPEMKVLYMSGYTDNPIVHLGMDNDGANFLQKPFSPTALAGKVRGVLDGPPAPQKESPGDG